MTSVDDDYDESVDSSDPSSPASKEDAGRNRGASSSVEQAPADEEDDLLTNKACEICTKPATRINFARFLCDSEECMNKAFDERGGPGGHKLGKRPPDRS